MSASTSTSVTYNVRVKAVPCDRGGLRKVCAAHKGEGSLAYK